MVESTSIEMSSKGKMRRKRKVERSMGRVKDLHCGHLI
jgi:hypothetical protein